MGNFQAKRKLIRDLIERIETDSHQYQHEFRKIKREKFHRLQERDHKTDTWNPLKLLPEEV